MGIRFISDAFKDKCTLKIGRIAAGRATAQKCQSVYIDILCPLLPVFVVVHAHTTAGLGRAAMHRRENQCALTLKLYQLDISLSKGGRFEEKLKKNQIFFSPSTKFGLLSMLVLFCRSIFALSLCVVGVYKFLWMLQLPTKCRNDVLNSNFSILYCIKFICSVACDHPPSLEMP